MYKTALVIGFFLLLSPCLAWAQTPTCSAQGYTVVFVNGVFDTEPQARADANALWFQLGYQFNNQPVTVQLGYNPSHLAGVGDLVESTAQLFNSSISDFDLDTILMQIYPEVTTRKLMLVGHSQGALYTNSMYDYLLAHGEPNNSVAVYNVATPAAYTAGNGKYINSSGDSLLALLRTLHFAMLPNNIDLVPADQTDIFPGHSFVNDYLNGAAPQILADMSGEMGALSAIDASQTGDCFTPPTASLGYQTTAAAFAVADPTATVLKAGGVAIVDTSVVALQTAYALAVGALQLFADAVHVSAAPPSDAQATSKTETIINKLYGSSVSGLSAQDTKELLGNQQGGAVALAGIVLGTSTESDTAAEPTTTPVASKSIFPASSNGPILGIGGGGAPAPIVADAVQPPAATDEPTSDSDVADIPPADIAADTTIATSSDDTASTTDTTADDTAAPAVLPVQTPASTLLASQEDSSGTPVHYWHSDGTNGAYLVLDPNDGQPGFSIGILATTDTQVLGIHIKAQFDTDGALGSLPKLPYLYDETGAHAYACARESFTGFAYGTPADALARQNPIGPDNQMTDMYFNCAVGSGHETVYANTSYRLYFYPVSATDVNDIYVAANASGTPYYEVSVDGGY